MKLSKIKLDKRRILVVSVMFFLLISVVLFSLFFKNDEKEKSKVDKDGNVILTEYQGNWYTDKKEEESSSIEIGELIKEEENFTQFKLDLSIIGIDDFNDVVVTVTGTSGTFVAPHNTMGGISFSDDYIQIIISHSDLDIKEGTVYNFKYNKSN